MQSYYFIKYNQDTETKHLQKYVETKSVICFDFEDSIGCVQEKIKYRQYFDYIKNELVPKIEPIPIGLRLNSQKNELNKDLEKIRNHRINSVLIPKVETSEQLFYVEKKLIDNNVVFDELIPIIESRVGLDNLEQLISHLPKKVTKIGFGHCDYNYSIQSFPFFHQNTKQYWKWINKFASILNKTNLSFINSAYLDLENLNFFREMLLHQKKLFGIECCQFSLTTKQATLVSQLPSFDSDLNFNNLLDDCYDLKIHDNYVENLIIDFKKNNKNKNFAINRDKKLISPQEYQMAIMIKAKVNLPEINFTFVGGCFPVQHNILFEDLFHQKLKRKIELNHNIIFNINLIRYERFLTCLDKIKKYHKKNPIDILIFHIRPEPFLRLVKFYYRYINNEGKLRHSLNIPLLKILKPEKHDLLVLGRRSSFLSNGKKSKLRKSLVSLNYLVGCIMGNRKFSQNKYYELTREIIEYCKKNGIAPIILGPAYRAQSNAEPKLCEDLNNFMKNNFSMTDIEYIDCLLKNSEVGRPFFNANGIHVNEDFHEYISGKLYEKIKTSINEITMPNIVYKK